MKLGFNFTYRIKLHVISIFSLNACTRNLAIVTHYIITEDEEIKQFA